jgi:hypothetical protein
MAEPQPFIFTDDMGEISGFGAKNPGYEASCRRMVIAGAEWIAQHPAASIRYGLPKIPDNVFIAANWETMITAETPETTQLLDAMHRACCADQGPNAGPSFAMMKHSLDQVRFVKDRGWDAYVAKRRELALEERQ